MKNSEKGKGRKQIRGGSELKQEAQENSLG